MNRPLILVGVALFTLSARAQTAVSQSLVFGKTDIAKQKITIYHFEPNAKAEALFNKGYLHHKGSFNITTTRYHKQYPELHRFYKQVPDMLNEQIVLKKS